jgi:hypothetical protein
MTSQQGRSRASFIPSTPSSVSPSVKNLYAKKRASQGPRLLPVATISQPATPWSDGSRLSSTMMSQSQSESTGAVQVGSGAASRTSPCVSNNISGNSRPSSGVVRVNPYARQKKRDGDSEGSSSNSAKRSKPKAAAASRIFTPEERMMMQEPLAQSMPVFDRFFCALLRSGPAEYRASLHNEGRAHDLWRTVCQRVSVSAPAEPIVAKYAKEQAGLHFSHRAALVLEEARQAIAQGLVSPPSSGQGGRAAATSMVLSIHNVETTNTMGTSRVTFTKRSKFTPEELSMIRPGNVVELVSRDFFARSETRAVLAVVASSNREQIEKKGLFLCLVFDPSAAVKHGQDWKVQNVASCISECRCFDAMTSTALRSSALVLPLLGHQQDDDGHKDETKANPNSNESGTKSIRDFFGQRQSSDLNETQEIASRTFLESPPNRVTLIQGTIGRFLGWLPSPIHLTVRPLSSLHLALCDDRP